MHYSSLQLICKQELVFISAQAEIIHMSEDLMLALTNLSNLIQHLRDMEVCLTMKLEPGHGHRHGCPRI